MEQDDFDPQLQAACLDAVENQLRDNNPPETRQTFERLRGLNIGELDAKLLIAAAIVVETYEIMKTQKPFNRDRFVSYLEQLPDLSFLD